MRPRSPFVIAIVSAAFALAALYGIYRLVDPLPPRHFAIAAGIAGSGYDNVAKQTHGYLHAMVLRSRSATLLAQWRILI
jgi:hypothetical protein